MNMLERAIGVISPKTACDRLAYRSILRNYYKASDRSYKKEGWRTTNASAEVTNRNERDIVRARARDLERNDDSLKGIIKDLERNVVGKGIMLQVAALDKKDKELPLCQFIEKEWNKWSKAENCTVSGQLTLRETEKLICRRKFIDGGILVLMCLRNGKFQIQLKEVDALDKTIVSHNGNRVIGGIEVDNFFKAVAYHFDVKDENGVTINKQRVKAENVLFLLDVTRVEQIREFSPTASSISKIDDINLLLEAALKKEQVQACFGVAVTSDGIVGGGFGRGMEEGNKNNEDGVKKEYIAPGMIKHLRPGEKIESISPAGMSSSADGIIRTVQRQVGAGSGLSYEATTRDVSQVNYSSARQNALQDKKTYADEQQYLIDHFLMPVYERWLSILALKENNNELFNPIYTDSDNVRWIPPGIEWIDPLKEAKANQIALETGQTTLKKLLAERGENVDDVIKQRIKEKKMLKELNFNSKNGDKSKQILNDSENKSKSEEPDEKKI